MTQQLLRRSLAMTAIIAAGQLSSYAQDFPGLRSSNYSGVNSVFFNPANIADSRFRFDVNLFAIQTQAGNKEASFKFSNLSESFKGDSSVSAQLFGKHQGMANGLVNFALHAPSVQFNAGNKWSFAVTTRSRLLMNFREVDGQLLTRVIQKDAGNTTFPYSIQSGANMRLNATGWTEFGVSAAREVLDKGEHFLKAGITVKYLAGTGNAYLNVKNFAGTVNKETVGNDVYLTNTTGTINAGFSGVKTNDFKAGDLTDFNSHGFGADLGLVYEWRPEHDQFAGDATANKYKLRVGLSVLDLGRLRFTPDASRSGSFAMHVTGSEQYYFSELNNVKIDNYKAYFDSRPEYFTTTKGENLGKYSVSLPATLQFDADYHVEKGFYVNLGTQLAMSSNKTKVYNSTFYNSITVTPRYENAHLGAFLPINYSQLTKVSVGLGARFGPVFLGSGSLFNLLFGNSHQADAVFGIHIYGLQKAHKHKEAKEPAEDTKASSTN